MVSTVNELGVSPNATRLSQFNQSQLEYLQNNLATRVEKMGRGGSLSEQENPLKVLRSEILQSSFVDSSRTVKEDLAVKIQNKGDFVDRFSAQLTEFKNLVADVRTHGQLPNSNFTTTVQNMLNSLENDLNKTASLGGTGEIYNNKVVDFTLLAPVVAATADVSYALGGDVGSVLCIDTFGSTTDISNLTAKDPMIEEVIRAMRLALAGDPTDPTDQNFIDAMDLANRATKKSTKVKESIVQQAKTIADSLEEMQNAKETEKERYEEAFIVSLPNSHAELESLKVQLDLMTNFRIQAHIQLEKMQQSAQRILG